MAPNVVERALAEVISKRVAELLVGYRKISSNGNPAPDIAAKWFTDNLNSWPHFATKVAIAKLIQAIVDENGSELDWVRRQPQSLTGQLAQCSPRDVQMKDTALSALAFHQAWVARNDDVETLLNTTSVLELIVGYSTLVELLIGLTVCDHFSRDELMKLVRNSVLEAEDK